MKFVLGLALFSASLVSAAVLPQIDARADLPSPQCVDAIKNVGMYHEIYDASCTQLVWDCLAKVNGTEGETIYLWSKTSCATAATCQGTNLLVELAQCYNTGVGNAKYMQTSLVTAPGKKAGALLPSRTTVDWFYGALSAVNATIWPDFANVEANWGYILDWTLTGDTLPYTNFDDWLHYSNS
ncbi:uncharacterized protein EV420DRAFT_1483808 [Desarmillaria tabescens]|uniref:Uncharacterized protein n=1 Tax=Armillaria tabescens TaxID=1929756 RepID=A0AA39JRA2_ARMTA|nr:uncharacterized protein EV420DRAFT_1483808 [Desarmillaria tabescens]KAK0447445.1 hypothetical protein EV420DRAFT_1483808 [Desarmillaria tabescens]